ncbi:MAG: hypothetical protein CVV41_22195 [Candidatus Riflebacteria bacterium HGW-Riflebacteria-1]|jgi:uncharacterized protein involved in exopolysaccharide biosynthesis|nr:MAG: hypothetical protein CVV41_22195 [Candidatus Riflebacteria bacterium HGW-Riflebacteria-1]
MNNSENNQTGERLLKIDLDQLLLKLWQDRRMLAAWVLALMILAIGGSFLATPLFTAEITFLPIGSKQLSVFIKSRATAKLVLKEIPEVTRLLKAENPTLANMAIELSKAVNIRKPQHSDEPYALLVELPNASMAADVANVYMKLVASFVNSPEYDLAKRNTLFIKEQYDLFAATLRSNEDALRKFQEVNGIILLDSQTAATVGLVAQIEARLVKKEIELQALQNLSENPATQKRANEIAALKDTLNELKGEQENMLFSSGTIEGSGRPGMTPGLTDAPRLRLEHQKLRREVAIAEQTCLHLQNQLTAARIQEEREGISFMVIDRAIVPEKTSYPNRLAFALFGGILGLLLGIFRSALHLYKPA